jgi:hypothetical protein
MPDFAKRAVLNTLGSPESKRAYEFAIDDFVAWYCSEPRLAFNKTVVLRYRIELEGRRLAPSTINLRLAAVRRLACEAADTRLLSPELATGARRVKGSSRRQEIPSDRHSRDLKMPLNPAQGPSRRMTNPGGRRQPFQGDWRNFGEPEGQILPLAQMLHVLFVLCAHELNDVRIGN